MLLLLHIIVTYIKENYTACPETLGWTVNCLCYLWKIILAWAIYHPSNLSHKIFIERPGQPVVLNTETLDWESSALTTVPLQQALNIYKSNIASHCSPLLV